MFCGGTYGLAVSVVIDVHDARRVLRVGGLEPFSTVDHPDHFSAVVFVQGCPWRCGYCHNTHLQSRRCHSSTAVDWAQVLTWLKTRRGLLDSVVFSGGEPLVDPWLKHAVVQVKALGFGVGLHTAGMYGDRLGALVNAIDWVGLDIKAPLDDAAAYARVTGAAQSAWATSQSLDILLRCGVDFECRTTVHPDWMDDEALVRTAADLARRGVRRWAVQRARAPRPDGRGELKAVDGDFPTPDLVRRLQSLMPGAVMR